LLKDSTTQSNWYWFSY